MVSDEAIWMRTEELHQQNPRAGKEAAWLQALAEFLAASGHDATGSPHAGTARSQRAETVEAEH